MTDASRRRRRRQARPVPHRPRGGRPRSPPRSTSTRWSRRSRARSARRSTCSGATSTSTTPRRARMTYVAVWSEELRGVDLEYLGTVVSLDDRPERDAVDPQRRPPRGVHRRRRSGPRRARGHDPVRREGRHGDAAHVRRRDASGVLGVVESRRDRRFTDGGEGAAAPARAAGGDGDRQRAPVPPAAGAGAPPGYPARREPGARRLRGPRRGADRPRPPGEGCRGRVVRHGLRVPAAPRRARLPRGALAGPAPSGVRDDALGTVYALDECPGERAILEASEAVQEHLSDRRACRRPPPVHGSLAAEDLPQPAAAVGRRRPGHPAPHDHRGGAPLHPLRAGAARGARGVRRRGHPQRASLP